MENMYSEEQYYKALEVYEETKSISKTMRLLGYPARRQTLYNWINRKRLLPENRSTFRGYNTAEHPRHPPLELKLDVIHRCFENGEDVQSVSDEIGYSTASIYAWRRKYILKGSVALMNSSKERKRGKLSEGEPASSSEIEDLKARLLILFRTSPYSIRCGMILSEVIRNENNEKRKTIKTRIKIIQGFIWC